MHKKQDNFWMNVVIGIATTILAAAAIGLWVKMETIAKHDVRIERLEQDMDKVLWEGFGIDRKIKG